ncbi:MAG: hypothetical protein ABIN01_00610 [Ferruginibacter sp.]
MSGFINHIIARHTNPVTAIRPRLPGKFEAQSINENISFAKPGIGDETRRQPEHNAGPSTTGQQESFNFSLVSDTRKHNQPQDIDPVFHSDHNEIDPEKKQVNNQHKNIDAGEKNEPLSAEFNKNDLFKNSFFNNAGNLTGHELNENKMGLASPSLNKNNSTPAFTNAYPDSNIEAHRSLDQPSHGYLSSTNTPAISESHQQQNFNPSSSQGSKLNQHYDQTPVIKVSIGRIEVRAITESTPAKSNRSTLQKPRMSLDDYLNKRNKGE